jgi:ElaA protein
MKIHWALKHFDELTVQQLYSILQLRNEVFVVEQNCVFQDADDKDQACYHLMGFQNELLVAYTRIVPQHIIYEEASIGRVVTSLSVRRNGAGKLLMHQSIQSLYKLFGEVSIKIGAQLYLKKFYEDFDFKQTGNIYIEDGIEHIHMMKLAAG